jgi:fatty-acyl-CoA synthase
VPQIGAVVVPINYRLTAADFTYLIQHSGAKVVCAHSDYLDAVDSIRGELPDVQAFVALESPRPGWLDYEATLAAAPPRSSVRRSARATSSPSTTRAAPPRGPRA